jgi:hypothetical protein
LAINFYEKSPKYVVQSEATRPSKEPAERDWRESSGELASETARGAGWDISAGMVEAEPSLTF